MIAEREKYRTNGGGIYSSGKSSGKKYASSQYKHRGLFRVLLLKSNTGVDYRRFIRGVENIYSGRAGVVYHSFVQEHDPDMISMGGEKIYGKMIVSTKGCGLRKRIRLLTTLRKTNYDVIIFPSSPNIQNKLLTPIMAFLCKSERKLYYKKGRFRPFGLMSYFIDMLSGILITIFRYFFRIFGYFVGVIISLSIRTILMLWKLFGSGD